MVCCIIALSYRNAGLLQDVNVTQTHTDWVERAAIGASLLCMAHCLALPLLIAALPAFSSALSLPKDLHRWIIAFAIPMALVALTQGRVRHGSIGPMVGGLLGLALLAAGAWLADSEAAETPLTVLGSLSLAIGHIANWRMRHDRAA